MSQPAITPKNNLVGCCGFELQSNPILDLGSLEHRNVSELLSAAYDDIIVRAISSIGPGFLLEFAASISPDISLRDSYNGICEVCHDVVTNADVLRVLEDNCDELAAAIEQREHNICRINIS